MKNFNAEMIEKAKTVKSAEELLELAKANGVEITADEAATYFAQLNPKSGELDDDDLDAVAGGAATGGEEGFGLCPLEGDDDRKRRMPTADASVVVSASITPSFGNGGVKA
jgi:predicted ribosomally synthesized peptide with nif11-like leader